MQTPDDLTEHTSTNDSGGTAPFTNYSPTVAHYGDRQTLNKPILIATVPVMTSSKATEADMNALHCPTGGALYIDKL